MRRAGLALAAGLFALAGALAAPAQEAPADLGALNNATLEALRTGDVAEAVARARAAVEAGRAAAAPANPLGLAYALNNLGYALDLTGTAPTEAAQMLDEAIAVAEAAGLTGADAWYLAMTNRANLAVAAGDTAAATALATRIIAQGRGTPEHGRAAGIASSIHYDLGQYVAAVAYLEELLAVEPALLRPYFGTVYTTYAEAQGRVEAEGRTDDAVALIDGRIAILHAFQPEDAAEPVQDLQLLKFFQLHEAERYGPAADALRAWAAAAPLSEVERGYADEMATLTLTATQYSSYTERREVQLDYAQMAVAFAEATGVKDDPRLGLALREVATAQSGLGLHEAAARTLRRGARVLEATAEGRQSLFLLLDDLAANAWQRGALEMSEQFYERAGRAYEAALADGAEPLAAIDLAIGGINRARLMIDLGRPGEALTLADEALAQFRTDAARGAQKWNSRAQEARIHAAAAVALGDLGQVPEALARIDTAIATARAAIPEGHPDLALLLANAADLLLVHGVSDRALALLEEAVAINRAALPAGQPLAIETEVKLALTHLVEGRRGAAVTLLRQIAEARKAPAYRDRLAEAAGDFETLAWALLDDPAAATADPAALNEALAALQWTQVTRSAEALTMMEARLAAADPLQAVWLRRRQDLREDHTRTSSGLLSAYAAGAETGTIRAFDARLARIEAEMNEVEDRLAEFGLDSAGIAGVRPLDIAGIQARLRPGEVLVTFLLPGLNPERIAGLAASSNRVIAITRDGAQVAAIPEISRRSLNARITAFRCEVALSDPGCATGAAARLRGAMLAEEAEDGGATFDVEAAYTLYRDLFGGIAPLLDGADHLILAPPADLLRLPFQALVTSPASAPGGTPDWLIRRHAISVLPSISSLRVLRDRPPPPATRLGRFLGLGDPVIGRRGAVDCASVRVAELRAAPLGTPEVMAQAAGPGLALARPEALRALPRLPDAACELQAIGEVFGASNSTILTAGAATERALKALDASGELAEFDVLVFATHGLTAGEAGARAPGLVLTPPAAATAEDDGLLSAAEIATLTLNARLVVLSACNTAAGENAEAEGMSGLARAFFHAGGTSLLVTHWSVYSAAAVEISTGMFQTLRTEPGLSHAEALRRAALAVIDDPGRDKLRTHPSYWAPFAIVGLN